MSSSPRRFWTVRRLALTSVLLLIGLVSVFIAWQHWLSKGGIFSTSSFDADKWTALAKTSSNFSCFRGGMANDIKVNVLRIGQTMSEVQEKLGNPNSSRSGVFKYHLGWCSGMRMDLDILDLHFDSNKQLTLIQIVQH